MSQSQQQQNQLNIVDNNNVRGQNTSSNSDNNQYVDSEQQLFENTNEDREDFSDNGLYQQMCQFEEDIDEDEGNEYIAELDTRNQGQSRVQVVDDSVFSDDVQRAFKKYQDEQEELYAQMEECWNYMTMEDNFDEAAKSHLETQSQTSSESAKLNPDAVEFKPSWLQSSSNTTDERAVTNLTSRKPEVEKLTK